MAVNRLVIWLIGAGSGIALFAGVTVAFVTTSNTLSKVITNTTQKEQDTNNKDNRFDLFGNNQSTNNAQTNDQDELNKLARSISSNDIGVYELNNEDLTINTNKKLDKATIYAFDLNEKQLHYEKSNELTNKQISIVFEIDHTNNSISALNKGIVKIKLKLTQAIQDKKISAEANLELNQFKDATKQFNDLMIDQKTQTSNGIDESFILHLTPKDNNSFSSIEQLNVKLQPNDANKQTSYLNTWFLNSNLDSQKTSQTELIGTVKLAKISKAQNNKSTQFDLVSEKENEFIKLTKIDSNNNKDQILLNGIRTINLLASSINVIPSNKDEIKTQELINNLQTIDSENEDEKYKISDESNKNDANDPTNLIRVGAYSVEIEKTTKTLPVNFVISFANKQYDTSNSIDLEELKNASFTFQLFTKQITTSENIPKANEIAEANNKLEEWFKLDHYTKPTALSEKVGNKETDKGGYFVTQIDLNKSETKFDLSLENIPLEVQDNKTPKYLITFANYSYFGISENNKLGFYSPDLNLIQLNIKQDN